MVAITPETGLLETRVVAGETLTRDDIITLSRATLASAGIVRKRQGGYSAKTDPHVLAMDNMPATYPPELKRDFSAAQLDRMNSGNVFEDYIGECLTGVAGVRVITEVRDENGERTTEGKRAKEEETFAAYLDPEVGFIFNARMGGRFSELVSAHLGITVDDEDRVSEPDAIELGPVMANGLRAMRFVDVKWHKSTSGTAKNPTSYRVSALAKPFLDCTTDQEFYGSPQIGDLMQLSHYYRHGESLHCVDDDTSLWGAVIGKEEVLLWARLDEARYMQLDPTIGKRRKQSALEVYDRKFAKALEVIDNAMARDIDPTVPALTFPEWSSEVKESQWVDVIAGELAEHGNGGHITLLPGITPERAKPLYNVGIDDVASLARLHPDSEIDGIKDVAPMVYQARSSFTGQVARAVTDELGDDFVNLTRADIEVDFDYETDDVVYQRGVRVDFADEFGRHGQSVEMDTYDDFTGTEAGELAVFAAMWERFQGLVAEAGASGRSICFYHYTGFERTQDLRLAEKYAGEPGVPTVDQVEDFYGSDLVVDLYQVLSQQLVWPTKSHSIKDLAPFVGFAWRDETPGGAESMVWYRTVRSTEDEAVKAELIKRGQEYNEDDVAAQLALREWVSGHGTPGRPGAHLPSVTDLPAPPL